MHRKSFPEMPVRLQPYVCRIADSALAEAGGVPLDALHRDAEAICRAYDAIVPLAERLKLAPPAPRLGGFSYCHVSALGAEIVFAEGSEPNVLPLIASPEDIDLLKPPSEYMSRGIIPQRLRTLEALLERHPDAVRTVDAHPEGPVTTAVLLMGPEFLMLPYTDPDRAHALLRFCVESGLAFYEEADRYFGVSGPREVAGIADDFAGMFPPPLFEEFVMPYWDQVYRGRGATKRHLHSELLRPEHLGYLKDLNITFFDPSADQYLTPQLLRELCPVPFMARILAWHVDNNSAGRLQALYRSYAACEPELIMFSVNALSDEPKVAALLEAARELAQEAPGQ